MNRYDPIIRRAFLAGAILWAVLLLCAPALVGLGNRSASLVAIALYTGCSAICHQRPERSFQLFGHQMPVCARCTGIYLGAALAALVVAGTWAASRAEAPNARRQTWTVALASVLPSLATLIYEWTTGDMPSNWTRAAAGFPMGAVVSWLVLRIH
jgi:uncharacterized membrane protein